MIPLPADAQARIERALAQLELAVIRVHQHPPRPIPKGTGYYYEGGHSPTDLVVAAILAAVAVIVDVVTTAAGTAADRRQIVATYCDQLVTQYATSRLHHVSRVRFEENLRTQPWWGRFQQTLQQAERTDIPSFGQQLKHAMDEARVNAEWVATETQIHQRTIERVLADERLPKISNIGALEAALTKARGGQVFKFLLPKSVTDRKRSPNAAKRR